MAMRRPRIKPVANIQLNVKRKPKNQNDAKTVTNNQNDSQDIKKLDKQDDIHIVDAFTTPTIVQDKLAYENINEVREDVHGTPASKENLKSDKEDELNQQNEKITENNLHNQAKVVSNENDNKDKHFKANKIVVKESGNIQDQAKRKEVAETELASDCNAFKCPPKVDFQRSVSQISNSGVDDVFYSDIEENALNMDMEKSAANVCPTSPSKNLNRQRIKPTPHFGQRRNSIVGNSLSPHTGTNEENTKASSEIVQSTPTRRERHYSASYIGNNHSSATGNYHHNIAHKFLPSGIISHSMGRMRTESGCSVFSDTNTSTYKIRKHEDNKLNLRKEFEARFFNGVPEKSVIKMSDLIYYNPVTNPMEQKPNPNVKLEQTDLSSKDVKAFDGKDEEEREENDAENNEIPVPQLKLNAKGELILDDKSLVIETTAEQEARKVLANSSLIYLDENTGMNGFYSRQKRTREWLPSETIKFYRCLQNVGTDFSLMVSLFPNRTRRDLKLKFKKEERKNAHLINKALLYPKQFDLEALKQQINEEDKLRDEQVKSIQNAVDKAKRPKKRKLSTSAADRVLQSDVVYQNENVEKQKRVRKTINTEKSDSQTKTIAVETDRKKTCKNGSKDRKAQQMINIQSNPNTCNDQENQQTNEVVINNSKTEASVNNNKTANNKSSKPKRRRRRTPNKLSQKEDIVVKEEIIKIESKQDSSNGLELTGCPDGTELQIEMDELLNTDAVDTNYSTSSSDTQMQNNTLDESQVPQKSDTINTSLYSSYITEKDDNCYQADVDTNLYEVHTIIDLDDGSINDLNTTPSTPPRSESPQPDLDSQFYSDNNETFSKTSVQEQEVINNETYSPVICEKELNEEDIQSILTELADGSLVLVSSLDPDDPDKVLNEIYMVDKNTGDLCDEPLSIPDNIVQCILSVLS